MTAVDALWLLLVLTYCKNCFWFRYTAIRPALAYLQAPAASTSVPLPRVDDTGDAGSLVSL